MNNAVITTKTDQQTKNEAQKLAKQMGLSLSGVVNALIKNFVRNRKLEINLVDKPELTDYAKKIIEEGERDYNNGDYYSFDSVEKSLDFLNKIAKK